MNVSQSDQTAQLLIARRLMIASEQISARRKDPHARVQSAKEAMEEDQALISGKTGEVKEAPPRPAPDDETRIRLPELIARLRSLQENPEEAASAASREQTTIVYTRRETQVDIRYRTLSPVEGLARRSEHLAETDRYEFEFQDGATFKITDKWSGKSTTIWGDPHVDTSDEEGSQNGEFTDLKSSETHTTLMLEDGTRVTFTALDNGVIEAVDIFKDGQHLSGVGAASADWGEGNRLFAGAVKSDADSARSRTPLGDVVYAGGDGNDWYDAARRLVWGQTTGPRITSRPAAVFEMSVRQVEEQAILVHTVERSA